MARKIGYILAFIAIFLLSVPISSSRPQLHIATDGYRFNKTTRDNKNFSIKIITYNNLSDLQEAALLFGADKDTAAQTTGFSLEENEQCVIHIVDPKIVYVPEIIGHELTHCIYGKWHDPI